jgi:small redox-active disulfide protein 2
MMLTIKVLGPGCANCRRLEQIAHSVIQTLALDADLVKVTDYNDILAHGVMNTPGLVINDQVVCSGRIPTEAEVTTWVADALQAT